MASEPYNRNIIAIESKQANAVRAKEFDIRAKLAYKQRIRRNKKLFRAGLQTLGTDTDPAATTTDDTLAPPLDQSGDETTNGPGSDPPSVELPSAGTGKILYVDHQIQTGDLSEVVTRIPEPPDRKNLMVISLHSCGNLVHHGLRSLIINPEVCAVAMIGCCYNLMTERLGPATYKLPELRPTTHIHPRLKTTSEARDPHGFPMSARFCDYQCPSEKDLGVRLNITSRMMAVQAPSNWRGDDSDAFFTRHFYRALLQRIFLDRGVVRRPTAEGIGGIGNGSSGGTPIIIGSLRKSYYANFVAYVRGALAKLALDPNLGPIVREKMLDITDGEIAGYEGTYHLRKKDLSVIWSLMAFSAGVVEAAIVVDRWFWLTEQDAVKHAWVEPVFDYSLSPRNLVVVGIKR